jgi:signal transduction histidine kinase
LFDAFYRGGDAAHRAEGSGLGLAIVKAFVELSGGEVSVESLSTGARFVIRLPASAAIAASVP